MVVPPNWADFARTVQIRSGGDVRFFNPYDYQEKLVELMLARSVILIKSRQLGISETVTAFMLWRACSNPGYLGLVISKTQTDSSLLARRMKRMIASLGLKTSTENVSDVEIQGYGRILFRSGKTPDAGRGLESVVDCFMDELAFLESGKEVYDSLAPAQQMVGDRSRIFAVSTPNGKSGFFWDLLSNGNEDKDIELICSQASKGETEPFQYWVDSGGWAKCVLHWRVHPTYGNNPNFLEEIHEKRKLSWDVIAQEYDLSFKESAVNVFSADTIKLNATGKYEHEIDKNAQYFLGVDTATVGSDYFACVVLKKLDEQYSLIKLYRKRQETSEYHLYQISQIIEQFKPTAVGIEITGGTGVIYQEQLSKQFKATKIQSIRTTGDSKPAMIASLQLALEKQSLKYPPNCPLIEELLSFRRLGRKLEASSGRHDDIIMSVCFALTVAESYNKWNFTNVKRIRLEN